jgi:hypothetical protein
VSYVHSTREKKLFSTPSWKTGTQKKTSYGIKLLQRVSEMPEKKAWKYTGSSYLAC